MQLLCSYFHAVGIGIDHWRGLPATRAQRLRARTLCHHRWRVRPHKVLAGVITPAPGRSPGNETEWRGKSPEKGGSDLPQCAQYRANPEVLSERRQGPAGTWRVGPGRDL